MTRLHLGLPICCGLCCGQREICSPLGWLWSQGQLQSGQGGFLFQLWWLGGRPFCPPWERGWGKRWKKPLQVREGNLPPCRAITEAHRYEPQGPFIPLGFSRGGGAGMVGTGVFSLGSSSSGLPDGVTIGASSTGMTLTFSGEGGGSSGRALTAAGAWLESAPAPSSLELEGDPSTTEGLTCAWAFLFWACPEGACTHLASGCSSEGGGGGSPHAPPPTLPRKGQEMGLD